MTTNTSPRQRLNAIIKLINQAARATCKAADQEWTGGTYGEHIESRHRALIVARCKLNAALADVEAELEITGRMARKGSGLTFADAFEYANECVTRSRNNHAE